MSWIKLSDQNHTVLFDGKRYQINESNFEHFIKQRLQESNVFIKVCKDFGVSPDLTDFRIRLVDNLDKMYAETNSDEMVVSKDSLSDDQDLSSIIFHEIYHYLKRKKEENKGFFGDDEEIEAFQLSIANMLSRGMDMHYIQKHVYPKIRFHFNDDESAYKFFIRMFQKAKSLSSPSQQLEHG